MPMPDRHEPFREIARAAGLDALALVPGANFTRLYGHDFHQNERPLVVLIPAEGAPAAVVPNLELASFGKLGFEGEVFDWRDQSGYQGAFDALLASVTVRRVGVEGQLMRVFVEQALTRGAVARGGARRDGGDDGAGERNPAGRGAGGQGVGARNASDASFEIVDAQREIASLRLRKNEAEIAALREAIRITETALAETVAEVRIGQTEKAIENRLVQRLFAAGADDFAFPPIVAAGDNAAQPHASARHDYAVRAGDALLIDCGARAGGLCADITRTFFVGRCSDEHARLHECVQRANEAGREAAGPATTAHAVDEAATAVLESSSWADLVRHKTGHGLGRDIHEDPYIMRGNHERLEPGTVFTVEPGLYREGEIGVRIEDDVLVTGDGAESLTAFERSVIVLDPA